MPRRRSGGCWRRRAREAASDPPGRGSPADAEVKGERIGIAGAGTMGAGIAQVACLGGLETHLHDPDPDALDAGVDGVFSDHPDTTLLVRDEWAAPQPGRGASPAWAGGSGPG